LEARGLSRRARARLRLSGARVLLYHGVGEWEGADPRYTVTRTRLVAHLEQIRRGGHPILPLAVVWSGPAEEAAAPAVALTFDDGGASDYGQVFPLLSEHGMVGEFFVNPGTIGHKRYLSWDQAREMARAGMRFQSHAYDHVYLTTLSAPALQRQVGDSKRRIEDELGCAVEFLAAPYGDLNRRVRQAALAAGYRAVCTSWSWPAQAGAQHVNRVAVYARTTPEELAWLLRGDPLPYLRRVARSAVLYPVKRAVLNLWPEWLTDRAMEGAE
jgi:peptidoglycan/xylan/chitin deacetylase (PgdA/CDA1 family)